MMNGGLNSGSITASVHSAYTVSWYWVTLGRRGAIDSVQDRPIARARPGSLSPTTQSHQKGAWAGWRWERSVAEVTVAAIMGWGRAPRASPRRTVGYK